MYLCVCYAANCEVDNKLRNSMSAILVSYCANDNKHFESWVWNRGEEGWASLVSSQSRCGCEKLQQSRLQLSSPRLKLSAAVRVLNDGRMQSVGSEGLWVLFYTEQPGKGQRQLLTHYTGICAPYLPISAAHVALQISVSKGQAPRSMLRCLVCCLGTTSGIKLKKFHRHTFETSEDLPQLFHKGWISGAIMHCRSTCNPYFTSESNLRYD